MFWKFASESWGAGDQTVDETNVGEMAMSAAAEYAASLPTSSS